MKLSGRLIVRCHTASPPVSSKLRLEHFSFECFDYPEALISMVDEKSAVHSDNGRPIAHTQLRESALTAIVAQ